MVWWYWVVAFVVSTLVSIALAPKPPRPRPAALEDFDFPVAEEGRPIPVIFGTVRVTGPNVLWYGDLSSQPIKKSSTFGGSQTIGYKYFVGLHFGLCHGPVDALTRVEVGEKLAWSGSQTVSGTVTIDKQKLFGGKKREGGISGRLNVCMGEPTQVANGYLQAQIGGTIPAYRGVMGLVWQNTLAGGLFGDSGGYIGNTAYPKPWAFTLRRITKGWQNDVVWYSAKAAIGTSMNAAHVLYQCLTDTQWGMGTPATALDDAAWQDVADTLYTEGFGLDLIWNQQSSIEDFIGIVLEHIGGIVRLNHSTGKIELVLVRGDYVVGDLDLFDESNITEISKYQRQGWGETINEVNLTFTDPTTRKTTQTTVQDLANIRSQGVVISERIDLPGLTNSALAIQCAQRELQARSTPLAQVTFTVNRRFWSHVVGDVVRLSWAPLGIVDLPVRVLQVKRGTLTDGLIEVSCIEDVFGLPSSTYTAIPAPGADTDVPDAPPDEDGGGGSVISTTTSAPPASPNDGDSYFVPTGATGAWAGQEGKIATWNGETEEWEFTTPGEGTIVYDEGGSQHVNVGAGDGTTSPAPWTPAIPPLAVATVDPLADHIVFYDASANGYRKALAALGGGGGGGSGGGGGVDGCSLRYESTLNLTTAGTFYAIPWEVQERDDADYWSATPNPTRLTIPRDGWFVIKAMARMSVGDTFWLTITKNGEAFTDYHPGNRIEYGTGIGAAVEATAIWYLSEGDYVEVLAYSRGGGDTLTAATCSIVSLLGSYTPPLADVILSTIPTGYWKCNESAGTTLLDSSGNGYDLTLTGSYSLADSPLVPSEPTSRFIRFTGGRADAASPLGLTIPFTGDFTFMCIVNPFATGRLASLCSVSGETEAVNYQMGPILVMDSSYKDFWEYGAGLDVDPIISVPPRKGVPTLLFFVRDTVANTWTVWRNAVRLGTFSYSNDPTGGSGSTVFRLAGDVDGSNIDAHMGHAAFWARKLSSDEIVSIAQAAGFFNVGGAGGAGGGLGGGGYAEELGYAGI